MIYIDLRRFNGYIYTVELDSELNYPNRSKLDSKTLAITLNNEDIQRMEILKLSLYDLYNGAMKQKIKSSKNGDKEIQEQKSKEICILRIYVNDDYEIRNKDFSNESIYKSNRYLDIQYNTIADAKEQIIDIINQLNTKIIDSEKYISKKDRQPFGFENIENQYDKTYTNKDMNYATHINLKESIF